MRVNKGSVLAALLTAPLLAASGSYSAAHASGFAVFTQGASALGQGNAVTAHSDDPSAVFYNPALMNKLPGTQVEFGSTLIRTSRDFRSDTTGNRFEAKTTTNVPTHIYATHSFNDKFSVGLGVFNPFGLKSEWGTSWEGRYLTTKSELTTYNVNPVVSYRVTPSLSIAAGVDVVFLDATLEKAIFSAGGDIAQKFKGDGRGVGYNVGIAYDISKDLTVGASYRSEVEVDVDGTSSTNPNSAPALFPLNAPASTTIKLPQQVTAGLAYRVVEPLIVEIGLRWEGWSSFDQLAIDLHGTPAITSVSRRDWRDALGGNIGAKYRVTPNVALLGGYLYGSTPVPSTTFDPTIPDANTHIFAFGSDIDYRKFRISLAYAYQMLDKRNKINDIDPALNQLALVNPSVKANGTYNTDAHLFGLSVLYRF